MKCSIIGREARFITICIEDGGFYHTVSEYYYEIIPNREGIAPPFPASIKGMTNRSVTSIFGLVPNMEYRLLLKKDNQVCSIPFQTEQESVTFDVRKFGARASAEKDDTLAIQSAIMACPEKGRVYIPAGKYHVTSLFLKSHIRIELAKGAELIGTIDPAALPILPGMIESYDEKRKYHLGTFEGNPLTSYASMLTGMNVEDCVIYGEGILNGNASVDDWWKIDKSHFTIARPNMIFLSHCRGILLAGLHITKSPMWTVHPYYSEGIDIFDISIENPWNSPNTDGIDPESCKEMQILGVKFSLGDDCIAIKSGKIYMGNHFCAPASDILIAHCLMEKGHGAVTIGSEIASGVTNIQVEKCLFRDTDRGLRVKTRRGRGKKSVLDGIRFCHIKMEGVKTPFVVNSFYFCDPDGKTEYVQTRETLPVDARTPTIGKLSFEDINCEDAEYGAAYYLGLPEQPIEEINMKDIQVTFKKEAQEGSPAMALYVPNMKKAGIYAENVRKMRIERVKIEGQEGDTLVTKNVCVE